MAESPEQPPRPATPAPPVVEAPWFRDAWLLATLAVTGVFYAALPFLRPTGENWGHGWNLVAYFVYSAPAVLIAGGVALWRSRRSSGLARQVAGWVALAALLYPVACLVAIRVSL